MKQDKRDRLFMVFVYGTAIISGVLAIAWWVFVIWALWRLVWHFTG